MKFGTVYESNSSEITEIRLGDILKIAKPFGIWAKRIGLGLIILSALGIFWVYQPLAKEEIKYQVNNNPSIQAEPALREQKSSEYKIYIPKIGAESTVIPNVDPFDKNVYSKALLEGVAEAKGLAHPGEMGTTFLFAHSVGNRIDFARYNAVFYLLDRLVANDKIYIVYNGYNFEYEVEKKEILKASDLRYLQPQLDEEKLVLQTCYLPGTSWKRLVVVGKRIL